MVAIAGLALDDATWLLLEEDSWTSAALTADGGAKLTVDTSGLPLSLGLDASMVGITLGFGPACSAGLDGLLLSVVTEWLDVSGAIVWNELKSWLLDG